MVKLKRGEISPNLIPSGIIRDVASKAAGMGTTLWFTDEEIKGNMLNSIIACGQFTICWNLLEYIEKIKKNPINTNDNHKILMGCESQLQNHWEKFKVNPFWMIEQNSL